MMYGAWITRSTSDYSPMVGLLQLRLVRATGLDELHEPLRGVGSQMILDADIAPVLEAEKSN